jgi:HK97 family phage prohead protease
MASALTLRTSPVQHSGNISIVKSDNDLVIAGYASVEMVDKQGDLITRGALRDAFDGFMKADGYRNVQLAHSNIQVGEVINNYTDHDGRVWKSGVDDAGMFVVIKLRDDIEKAREVANEIRKGALRGFSIGGQAFKRMRKSDSSHGDYTEISKLELHEVTICEKGINPEATFRILKEDTNMNDDNVLGELSTVLDRLNGRLDTMEKGDLPAFMEDKKDEAEDKPKETKDDKDEKDDEDMDDKKENPFAKGDYSDVITTDYLNWMENTLKSQGVDISGARTHFDDVSKANLGSTPEQIGDGADYFAGQVKGRAQEGGNPSTGAIGKLNSGSGKSVAKGYLSPEAVSASDLEAASTFDARTPLANIEKALSDLSGRIDSISTSAPAGVELRKSASTVEIPSTVDLGNMDWDDVHRLAGSVWHQ